MIQDLNHDELDVLRIPELSRCDMVLKRIFDTYDEI